MKVLVLSCCLILVSCSPLVNGIDYSIDQENRIIIARNTTVAGNICLMRSVITKPEVTIIYGCYDPNDDVVIIAADSPQWVIYHEFMHRNGWRHE